ncbi:phage portal protein [Erythrobacter litoralis]|nr:phage portal protein [Erythrobacter litoralis]
MRGLRAKAATFAKRALDLLSPDGWRGLFAEQSTSGKTVTAHNALTLSTVWACTRLVAGTMSSLPIMLYRDKDDGSRTLHKEHPLYGLLRFSPNADQSALDFWQFVFVSLELWGNAYARIVRGTGNKIVALLPIRPEQVRVRRGDDGRIRYRYTDGGKAVDLRSEEMFHIRGFGGSPMGGLSTLAFGRQSFGLALATDEAAAHVFRNGLRPTGVLTTKDSNTLKPQQRDDIYKYVVEPMMGDNNGKPLVLEAGLGWQAIQLNLDDAQMIESRQFSVEDGCRWFGVPPHMVGHTTNSTSWGSGLEQQTLGFLVFTLRERIKRVEQAIAKQLLTPVERLSVTVEFNIEGLLRADSAARAAFYAVMAQNGIMTRNEIRRLENLPPVEGGDELTIQSNMIPASKLGELTSTSGEQAKRSMIDWLGLSHMLDAKTREKETT